MRPSLRGEHRPATEARYTRDPFSDTEAKRVSERLV